MAPGSSWVPSATSPGGAAPEAQGWQGSCPRDGQAGPKSRAFNLGPNGLKSYPQLPSSKLVGLSETLFE